MFFNGTGTFYGFNDMLEMKIMNLYEKNKFKLDTVRIPYPEMPWQNYVIKPKHCFEF